MISQFLNALANANLSTVFAMLSSPKGIDVLTVGSTNCKKKQINVINSGTYACSGYICPPSRASSSKIIAPTAVYVMNFTTLGVATHI